MRLLTARTIEHFAANHAGSRQALADWSAMVEAARWRDAEHLRSSSSFPARPIGNKRVVFNIKGNDYRIVCDVQYADAARNLNGVVRVQFIGTHADYDDIDAESVVIAPNRP